MRWAMEQARHAFGVPTPRQACAAFLDYHLRDGIAEKITCRDRICSWLDDTLGAPDQHTRTGDQNQ
jgi:hypothetical protein